jgi:hypothetical protein
MEGESEICALSLNRNDACEYFKNMFDRVLERDPEYEELFKELILKHGTKMVYDLTNILKYEEARTIHERAFRVCITALFEVKKDREGRSCAEIAFGCRDPKSKGYGYWDSAFVVIKEKGCDIIKCFLFQDGQDDVEEVLNVEEAVHKYNRYCKKRWKPMTVDDLTCTTGVSVDENTVVTPPAIKKRRNAYGYVATVLGLGLVLVTVAKRFL